MAKIALIAVLLTAIAAIALLARDRNNWKRVAEENYYDAYSCDLCMRDTDNARIEHGCAPK